MALAAFASPKWRETSGFTLRNGGTATVYIDPESIVEIGKHRRVWVMTDFSEAQTGTWKAPPGESNAYMSTIELWLLDCRLKDFAVIAAHAVDGPMGDGVKVNSESIDIERAKLSAAIPGSMGARILSAACAAKLRP